MKLIILYNLYKLYCYYDLYKKTKYLLSFILKI